MNIWKFTLRAGVYRQGIRTPRGAELLHAGEQDGELVLWARVDQLAGPALRWIVVSATGQMVYSQPHVGTVQMPDGLVWHVFDGGEETR